ncbi:HalOD1 output domain-containing protein [Halosimplex sp. J119]
MGPNQRSPRRQSEELFTDIVSAVATDTGVDVFELPPLGDVLDPEALQTLLAESEATVEVSFDYAGREVVLEDERIVAVRDRGPD